MKPTPLKVGNRVRIGTSGHMIWTVHCGPDNGMWHLVSDKGAERYIPQDRIRRVGGPPIAALTIEQSSAQPRPVAMRDKVLFTESKARTLWTVIEIDERELRIVTHRTYRYVSWRAIENGKVVHANGAPIAIPAEVL